MHTLTPHHQRTPPNWLSVPGWVAVFLSPTICFLLLIGMGRLFVPAPTEGLAVLVFRLIAIVGLLSPLVALLACGTAVWRSQMPPAKRVVGLLLTLLGMSAQVGILLLIIVSAVTVMIAPAQ